MPRRRLLELLPVYLLAVFAVAQAVVQVVAGDWPVAVQLVTLGVFVVLAEHIAERRRDLAYRNGFDDSLDYLTSGAS